MDVPFDPDELEDVLREELLRALEELERTEELVRERMKQMEERGE